MVTSQIETETKYFEFKYRILSYLMLITYTLPVMILMTLMMRL